MLTSPVVVAHNDLCLVGVGVKGACAIRDRRHMFARYCPNVAIESILTTVEDDGSCGIIIQNLTYYPVSLKSGVALEDILSFHDPVTPLDSSPCHAILSSNHTSPDHDSLSQPLFDHHIGRADFKRRNRIYGTAHLFQVVCFVAG